jgi:tetratricopeptide (TPR) repeat protein
MKRIKHPFRASALALAALMLLVCAPQAFSQAGGSNSITGFVRNEGGDPVGGAVVYILDSNRKKLVAKNTVTDAQGRYELRALACGAYFLVVEAEGYESIESAFSCFETADGARGSRGSLGGTQERNVTLLPVGTTILPKEAIEHFPAKASSKYKKALKKMDKGDMAGAKKILEDVLEIEPDFHYARAKLGEIHKLNGETETAMTELSKAVEQNPKEVMGRVHLATLHIQAGKLDQAAPLLEEAVAVAPNYADAWFNLGLCCSRLEGQTERAEEALLKTLELDPENPGDALLLLANTYLGQEKLKDALQRMEQWLELGIQSPMTARVTETVEQLRTDPRAVK